ncbi:MAG: serine/threonine-protein phosphatase [Anaerolineae bacterium]|nr:serine/threonine-protein phosphatase [Anaerolineae bacterium]
MNFLRRLFGQEAGEEVKVKEEKPAEPALETTDQAGPAEAPPGALLKDDTPPVAHQGLDQSAIQTSPLAQEYEIGGSTRQLDQTKEIAAFTSSPLMFGYNIDVGMTRENNQDALVAYAVSLRTADREMDFGLFGIADGMGGHLHGEKASAIVASTITSHVFNNIYLPLLRMPPGEQDAEDTVQVGEVLMRSLREANDKVLDQAPGSGTTATFAVTIGNAAYVVHIGDSRAYLITGQGIEQITRDHSLAQRLFEVGQLTRTEMGSFPRRNELYKVVGFTEDIDPDLNTRRLPPGSYLLLCSDGLWGEVPEVIMENVVITEPPQAACAKLVQMANERGGHDNISVVIVKIPS